MFSVTELNLEENTRQIRGNYRGLKMIEKVDIDERARKEVF
jgi:hypothetical protein